MSSNESTEAQLKAGHPPAVKVAGGVRVKTNVKAHEVAQEHAKEKKDTDEFEKQEEEHPDPNAKTEVVVGGAPAKGDRDFPAQAVKAFHEKPMPAVQAKVHNTQHHIQQPKK